MEHSLRQKGKLPLTLIMGLFSMIGLINTSFAESVKTNSLSQHGVLVAFGGQNHHGNANRNTPNNFRGANGNQTNRFRNNNVNNLNGRNRNNLYRNNPYNNVNGSNVDAYVNTSGTNGVNGSYTYQGVNYPNLQAYCTAACVVASNGQRSCPNVCH